MQLFQSATLKLTLWYLLILAILSISFSAILYHVSSDELQRGFPRGGSTAREMFVNPSQFEILRQQRILDGNGRLLQNLVLLNVITLGLGGWLSYLLAKQTLRPVREAMEAQGRFTSDASHELRTPLTAMQTEIEVALRDPKLSKTDLQQLLKSNLEEVNKLRALSDRLLQLSNESELHMESVVLDTVAIESMGRVISAAQAKNISIENNVGPLQVFGNAESLADMLTILLDNAVKYSPPKTQITLRAFKRGHNAHIEVIDQGPGMKASDIPHIFDRFYRADTSRNKQRVDGYGLGLSLAKRISKLHSGEIKVRSKSGKGSTFTVVLPVASS